MVGKTGTSNKSKDAWFVGALPNIAFGVWVGYDAPQTLGPKETGGRSAAPIILSFLQKSGWSAGTWRSIPQGVESARIDPKSGLLARGACSAVLAWHLPLLGVQHFRIF